MIPTLRGAIQFGYLGVTEGSAFMENVPRETWAFGSTWNLWQKL